MNIIRERESRGSEGEGEGEGEGEEEGEGEGGREGGRERERERERERPDSVAERLCSKAVDWEVSGSILAMGILSLTGPSPRVLK